MPLLDLVDTHCHLSGGGWPESPEVVWQRARGMGVTQAIVVGIDARNSEACLEFARANANTFATAGIHPNDSERATPEDFETIVKLSKNPEVVAIGETGLDFYRDSAEPKIQERALIWHAELALAVKKPIILHIRDAFPAVRSVLLPFIPRGLRGVVHCFGGARSDIHPFVDWGFSISFSGILTYPKAPEIREAAKQTPLDLLLIETDAPWLAPVPKRGQVNEPAFVAHTCAALAAVRSESVEMMASVTSRNARGLFALPAPG